MNGKKILLDSFLLPSYSLYMSYATLTEFSDDWSTEEATALETFATPELETTLEVDGPDRWNMSDADIKAICADE